MVESYKYSHIDSTLKVAELERLKRQAQMFWPNELAMLSRLDLKRATSGADIGCGHGFVSALIASTFPQIKLCGLDISEELISTARSVHGDIENLEFAIGSAYDIKLPDDSQDFIYSRLVYQHLSNPEKAIGEAFRICAPGGQIGILDIDSELQLYSENPPALKTLLSEISKAQRERGGNREIGRQLPLLLKEAGFSNIDIVLEPISTLQIPLEQFCAITMGFAEWFIADDRGRQIYTAALNELTNLKKPIFAMLAVMFVYGRKLPNA